MKNNERKESKNKFENKLVVPASAKILRFGKGEKEKTITIIDIPEPLKSVIKSVIKNENLK